MPTNVALRGGASIVGVVLAAPKGLRGRSGWIAGRVGAGVAGACLVAVFAGALSELFQGAGQETFTAVILLLAVVMLTWHVVWMAQHGRATSVELKQVGEEVRMGQRLLLALAVVVAVAVLHGPVRSCQHRLEQHLAARFRFFRLYAFRFVVAEAILAGGEDHRGRHMARDIDCIMPRPRDDLASGIV